MNAIRREHLLNNTALTASSAGPIRSLWDEWQRLAAAPYESDAQNDARANQMKIVEQAVAALDAASLDDLECKLELARTLTAEGVAVDDNLMLGALTDFRRLVVPGVPDRSDPIVEMLERRNALADAAALLPSPFTPGGNLCEPPEVEAAWDLVHEVTDEIERTPATTLSGVVAKLTLRAEIDDLHSGYPARKSPYHAILADIERLAEAYRRGRVLPFITNDQVERDFMLWLERTAIVDGPDPAVVVTDEMVNEVSDLRRSILRSPTRTFGGIAGKLHVIAYMLKNGLDLCDPAPFETLIDDFDRIDGVLHVPWPAQAEQDPVVALAAEREGLRTQTNIAHQALMAVWQALPADVCRSPAYTTRSYTRIMPEDEPSDVRIKLHCCGTEEALEQKLLQWKNVMIAPPSEERIQAARAEWHADKARIDAALAAADFIALDQAYDEALAREDAVEEKLIATPATTAAGLVAQMEFLRLSLEEGSYAETISDRILASLRCLAHTGSLLPCRSVQTGTRPQDPMVAA